jgi:hypothetical protein
MAHVNSKSHRDEPTYWFAILEIARSRGDSERIEEATRQLRRLGICISYEQPQASEAIR